MGETNMVQITLLQAKLEDAEQLTAMMKKTFDEEARTWLGSLDSHIVDYNIQPPGYHAYNPLYDRRTYLL